MNYLNSLSIGHEFKGVPYGGVGEVRADGDANYGFKVLKNNAEAISTVPELQRDTALKALVETINMPSTDLFSIGCVSGLISDDSGYRYTGYIEFAINSRSAVQSAASYFPVFFNFEQYLKSLDFNCSVKFDWEILPVHFIESGITGFSLSVTINTHYSRTMEAADGMWKRSLLHLSNLLQEVKGFGGDVIY